MARDGAGAWALDDLSDDEIARREPWLFAAGGPPADAAPAAPRRRVAEAACREPGGAAAR
jgi:hypothetical protein